MQLIQLENGRSLRRRSEDHRWAVFSAEGNFLRYLDEADDEFVSAAYVAGKTST